MDSQSTPPTSSLPIDLQHWPQPFRLSVLHLGRCFETSIDTMTSPPAGGFGGVPASVGKDIAAAGGVQNPATQAESAAPSSNVTASQSGAHATPAQQQPQQQNQPAQSQPLDLMRRNTRPEPSTMRSQPDRSRSRAKRRFSGSTANSSHSPGSERGTVPREREEGRQASSGSSRRIPDSISIPAKPAPWGIIGVCALDVKARSKPSRNILNRLINNREFDVVVFGDKVILDEGKYRPPCFVPLHVLTGSSSRGRELANMVRRSTLCYLKY